ncbi:AAA family ATPase [Microbacterium sp. SL75]|uniref:AAA family ATPase n=1 Tax=Microbacterium sp. SL75 TaxID=2995140 RepID=UPI00226F9EAE|nr:ABC transporter ATP-binding protein [Microbacterium sp. SL75]WAC67744.1 ABC transporter ATP-binding protein [Microbacterium sp. SL75]
MKSVQAKHSWDRVTSDWTGRQSMSSLSTRSGQGFADSNVTMSGGLLILAGVNSGGKSRILRSIWSERNDPQSSNTVLTWVGDEPDDFVYVDLFELLSRQWRSHRIPDLREQVDAAGLSPLRSSDTATLSYVLGREYDSIRVAEIDSSLVTDETSTEGVPLYREEVVPYFEMTTSGGTHSSPSLSRGELSALTLHWALKSAPRNAVLLLDEPDIMLAPMSARRVLDLIVDHANSQKSPVIIATHSYLSLADAPRSAQALLRVGLDGKSSLAKPDDYALWDALRVAAPKQIVFVVEDSMARLLLNQLLVMADFPHFDVSEIWIGGSAAEVRAVGKLPQLKETKISLWGVLDGNEKISPSEKRCLKLPGILSPEEGALLVAENHEDLLSTDAGMLKRALERTVGDNPHDRANSVASAVGKSGSQFVVETWTAWLTATVEGREALETFRQSLRAVTPPERPV